ncbi:MAG: hypothetical protein ACC726_01800 [Chloroflexota bacterium]
MGEGALSHGHVLREALGMFRIGYARVAAVALVLFVPPPLLIALLGGALEGIERDPGLVPGLGFVIVILITLTIRLFGPVVYAGYLEAAVGHEYYHGQRVRLVAVLRSLPWIRLLVADVVLVVGTVVGLSFFVLPGLVWLTLFALVGPVIVQERQPVMASFRRTYQLSRQAWKIIFVMVVLLLGAEKVIEEVAMEFIHESGLGLQLLVEWGIAAVIGGVIGLVEVALATELMVRNPRARRIESGD